MIRNPIVINRLTRALCELLVLFLILTPQVSVAGVWGEKWGTMTWGGAIGTTASEIQVTEAYIGLLGRAPDPAGLAYWTAQLNAAVADGQNATLALKKLTNDITLSAEWDAGIGANDASNQVGAEAIVTAMYSNLFNRPATAADKAYWSAELVNGTTTASEMVVQLITGAQSNSVTTDADVLDYKRQAATYYVQNVAQSAFTVSSAINSVKDVSDPDSLAASKAATDSLSLIAGRTSHLANPSTAAERLEEGSSIKAVPTAIPSLPIYGSSLLGCLLALIGVWNLRRASSFQASQIAASLWLRWAPATDQSSQRPLR